MLKRFVIALTIFCFLIPSTVCAEFASQFKKDSADSADLSENAPKNSKVDKDGNVMENNVNTNQKVMENNVNTNQKVMENNVNRNQKVMENNVNKNQKVME